MVERRDGKDVNICVLSFECSTRLTFTQKLDLLFFRIITGICVFVPIFRAHMHICHMAPSPLLQKQAEIMLKTQVQYHSDR